MALPIKQTIDVRISKSIVLKRRSEEIGKSRSLVHIQMCLELYNFKEINMPT